MNASFLLIIIVIMSNIIISGLFIYLIYLIIKSIIDYAIKKYFEEKKKSFNYEIKKYFEMKKEYEEQNESQN